MRISASQEEFHSNKRQQVKYNKIYQLVKSLLLALIYNEGFLFINVPEVYRASDIPYLLMFMQYRQKRGIDLTSEDICR